MSENGNRGRSDSDVALRKIFIGGLSYGTDDDKLRKYFSSYGTVQDAVVMKDPVSRRSRGFGFITFTDIQAVDNALAHEPHTIDSRRVEAKRAVPRSESVPSGKPAAVSGTNSNNNTSASVKSVSGSAVSNTTASGGAGAGAGAGKTTAGPSTQSHLHTHTQAASDSKPNSTNNTSPSTSSGASASSSEPKLSLDEYAYNKIFVGGLHYDTRDAEFKTYFERFGKVVSAEVMFNRETHKSRGFGFIIFEQERGAELVCAEKEHVIDGKVVEVKRAIPRSRITPNGTILPAPVAPAKGQPMVRSVSGQGTALTNAQNQAKLRQDVKRSVSMGAAPSPATAQKQSFAASVAAIGVPSNAPAKKAATGAASSQSPPPAALSKAVSPSASYAQALKMGANGLEESEASFTDQILSEIQSEFLGTSPHRANAPGQPQSPGSYLYRDAVRLSENPENGHASNLSALNNVFGVQASLLSTPPQKLPSSNSNSNSNASIPSLGAIPWLSTPPSRSLDPPLGLSISSLSLDQQGSMMSGQGGGAGVGVGSGAGAGAVGLPLDAFPPLGPQGQQYHQQQQQQQFHQQQHQGQNHYPGSPGSGGQQQQQQQGNGAVPSPLAWAALVAGGPGQQMQQQQQQQQQQQGFGQQQGFSNNNQQQQQHHQQSGFFAQSQNPNQQPAFGQYHQQSLQQHQQQQHSSYDSRGQMQMGGGIAYNHSPSSGQGQGQSQGPGPRQSPLIQPMQPPMHQQFNSGLGSGPGFPSLSSMGSDSSLHSLGRGHGHGHGLNSDPLGLGGSMVTPGMISSLPPSMAAPGSGRGSRSGSFHTEGSGMNSGIGSGVVPGVGLNLGLGARDIRSSSIVSSASSASITTPAPDGVFAFDDLKLDISAPEFEPSGKAKTWGSLGSALR